MKTKIVTSGDGNVTLSGTPLVALSGPAAGDFSIVSSPITPVGPNITTTFQVRFSPSATGLQTATLTIANNDSDENPYDFAIQATVAAVPIYASAPAAGSGIDVGSAAVNRPITTTLAISNTGNTTLNVTGHTLSGAQAADFSVSPASLTIQAGGAAQNLTITCTPKAFGVRTATLTVNHNAPGSPATYTLTCRSYGIYLPLAQR